MLSNNSSLTSWPILALLFPSVFIPVSKRFPTAKSQDHILACETITSEQEIQSMVVMRKDMSDPTHKPAQEHPTSSNTSVPPKKGFIKLVGEIGLQLYCSVLPLTLGSRHEGERPAKQHWGNFDSGSAARRKEG